MSDFEKLVVKIDIIPAQGKHFSTSQPYSYAKKDREIEVGSSRHIKALMNKLLIIYLRTIFFQLGQNNTFTRVVGDATQNNRLFHCGIDVIVGIADVLGREVSRHHVIDHFLQCLARREPI